MIFKMFSFIRNKIGRAVKVNQEFSLICNAVAISDTGVRRKNNEDNILFIKPRDEQSYKSKGCLAIVCDGMGGHNFGEIASKIAIDEVSQHYYNNTGKVDKVLKKALAAAHLGIVKMAQQDNKFKNMGTTCTAAVIIGETVHIGHVGDSRAYLISKKEIKQLTEDHTYVNHLYKTGVISKQQANNHPEKNIVTMVLGTQGSLNPAMYCYENVLIDSRFLLLCSDGLNEYVSDEELKEIVFKYEKVKAAETLINMAKLRGGHDNISVVIVNNAISKIETDYKVTQKILQ